MAADMLRLRVVFDLADRALAPLKRIAKGSKATAQALSATRKELRDLNAQQSAVEKMRGLQQQLNATGQQAKIAAVMLAQLKRETPETAAEQRKLAQQIAAAEKELRRLNESTETQRKRMLGVRRGLNEMGVRNLGEAEARLRGQIDATTRSVERQHAQLSRLAKIRETAASHGMKASMAAGAGYAMFAGGSTMLRGAAAPIGEGKGYANEVLRVLSLGLGDEAAADSIKYARAMKTYGTSTTDNLGLMRDALTAFADVHHAEMVTPLLAKMKFANEAVYGAQHAEDNEKKFMDMLKVIELRGGLSSKEAFTRQANIVQQVLTATGGRVGPEEWLNTIKTGGVAAKGIGDEAFYYQLEPLVQEMGGNRVGTALMSAYQNVYQGKTTKRAAQLMQTLGLIADPSKVKHDKVGQISQLGIGALKGSDIFRQNQFQWMEEVLLPTLAEKGITEKQQILDAIGGMFSNRTASNLFAQMYLQRDQIHKNAQLNARADGIDGLYEKARGSAAGGELELLAKKRDLYNQISSDVMPIYVKMLEKAARGLDWLRRLAEQHPTLTKAMGVAVAGLSLAMAGLGLMIIPIAVLAGKFIVMRYLVSTLGLKLFGLSTGMQLISKLGSFAGRAFTALVPILSAVGSAIVRLGALMLTNPIGLALTLIAVAAFMVWRNWDGIKGGLIAIWEDLSGAVSGWWASISAGGQAAWQYVVGLKDRFLQAGADLMAGLTDGITSRLAVVRDTITGAADSVAQWFRDALGIRSPSRVFIEAGGFIAEGAALGISGRQDLVRRAALALAGTAVTGAAMAADGMGTEGQPLVVAQRPVVASRQAGAGAAAAASPAGKYQITINASPGMDPQAIARAVSAELDRRDRAARSRVLSSMSDID